MDVERLLAGLNAQQLRTVTTDAGPVVCIAGAGTGKTRVLTRRIARRVLHGETDPQRVMAVTFTNKSATELANRIYRLGLRENIVTGTFHGLAMGQIKQRWADKGQPERSLLEDKIGFVRRCIGKEFTDYTFELANEFDWAKAQMIDADDYERRAKIAGRSVRLEFGQVAELMVTYEKTKRSKRMIDFDDLLYALIGELNSDDHFAAATRWRFRHFYVDEFQDINPLQYELLQQWRGDSDDLFIVGDPNQAIYGWNGADPQLLQDFVEVNPEAEVIKLNVNYRSSPQILQAATSITDKTIALRNNLVAYEPDGVPVNIFSLDTDVGEAEYVINQIASASGTKKQWSDYAILARTQKQLKVFTELMDARGIRYKTNSETKLPSELVTGFIDQYPEPIFSMVELDRVINNLSDRDFLVETLQPLVTEYQEGNPSGKLESFITWLRKGEAQNSSVSVLTFHAAKGLEWPTVFVTGLEEGYVPITYAKTKEQTDEEQRLLYVALTRAEKELTVTWCKNRTFGQYESQRKPSRFVGKLREVPAAQTAPAIHRAELGSKIVALRQDLGAAPDSYPAKLNAWRKGKSMGAQVTEAAILSDAVVKQLKALQPKKLSELKKAGMRQSQIESFGEEIIDLSS